MTIAPRGKKRRMARDIRVACATTTAWEGWEEEEDDCSEEEAEEEDPSPEEDALVAVGAVAPALVVEGVEPPAAADDMNGFVEPPPVPLVRSSVKAPLTLCWARLVLWEFESIACPPFADQIQLDALLEKDIDPPDQD